VNTIEPSPRFTTLALPGTSRLAGLSVEPVNSGSDLDQALELRWGVYRRKGLLREQMRQPQLSPQTCVAGSAIFVAREQEAIVGTISFYMDSAMGLPMDDVHGDEVNRMRRRFTRVAEVGGLAVMEDRRGRGITAMLYQATLRWALSTGTECILACVNPSSRRVYSKLLLFEILGECKPHPRFQGAPSIPIALDLTTAAERYRETHGSELDMFYPCETARPRG
jgi:GNAT superfamily N-acetyltransferase